MLSLTKMVKGLSSQAIPARSLGGGTPIPVPPLYRGADFQDATALWPGHDSTYPTGLVECGGTSGIDLPVGNYNVNIGNSINIAYTPEGPESWNLGLVFSLMQGVVEIWTRPVLLRIPLVANAFYTPGGGDQTQTKFWHIIQVSIIIPAGSTRLKVMGVTDAPNFTVGMGDYSVEYFQNQ